MVAIGSTICDTNEKSSAGDTSIGAGTYFEYKTKGPLPVGLLTNETLKSEIIGENLTQFNIKSTSLNNGKTQERSHWTDKDELVSIPESVVKKNSVIIDTK